MNKKSVSASILVMFLALVFAVIGACFMTFVYQKKMIEFKEIRVVAQSGINVYGDKKLSKQIRKLKLSDMKLGLKPATGKLDAESKIPSTITDDDASEGYYETIYIKADDSFKIVIKNIKIETESNKLLAEEERKNIFVSIKGVSNTTKSLEEDEIEIVKFENIDETLKLTFLFWLGSMSGEELVGSKINFDIEFIKI